MQNNSLLRSVVSSLLLVGCVGTGYVRGSASVSAPDLVFVSPGVQVIADYDEPIFYSDSYYWRSEGNVWYRSSTYTGGWARFEVVPVGIRSIARPSAYVHFHGEARGNASAVVRDDGNAPRQGPPPTPASMPAQAREERKEEKAEQKQEQKQERKEEKAEQKQERKEEHNGHGNGHH